MLTCNGSSLNNSDSRPSNFLFKIARGSGATLSEWTFSSKSAHHQEDLFKTHYSKTSRYIWVLFYKEPGYTRLLFGEGSEQFQDMTLQLLVPNSKRLGATPSWMRFFLQKGTHHSKILESATWFRSEKYSDDACFYSARPEGTRRGFQSSTMKCSGACWCGTHGIPHEEGRRSSLTRILSM